MSLIQSTIVCAACGTPFTVVQRPGGMQRVVCSAECRKLRHLQLERIRNGSEETYTSECKHCELSFTRPRSSGRRETTCSPECKRAVRKGYALKVKERYNKLKASGATATQATVGCTGKAAFTATMRVLKSAQGDQT